MSVTVTSEDFVRTFDRHPAGVWSAPGRVNLIGEHTDYNDGFVLPFASDSRTTVAAAARDDGLVRLRSAQQPTGDVAVRVPDLATGSPGGWAAYAAGVVWAFREAGHDVPGLDLLVDGRVPLGAGLSSSAALECAVAMALDGILGLGLDADRLAVLAQRAENDFVGAPTGRMDQLASLRCTPGHAIFLDSRSLKVEQVPLDVASAGLRLLVANTRVNHDHAEGGYGERRAACERAAGLLGVTALRDVPADHLDAALARLPDDELRRRVRHVVTEDARVIEAVAALRTGGWTALGALMDASHASLRDDYEVSCEELDVAVAEARGAGALGARMTGGGFGGSAIALVPVDAVDAVAAAVTSAFADRGWTEPVVLEVSPSAGARRDA